MMHLNWKLKPGILSIGSKFVDKVHNRNLYIYPTYVGLFLRVSSGRKIGLIEIKPDMVGYHLGDFILTKKIGKDVHNLKKKSSSYRKKKLKVRK